MSEILKTFGYGLLGLAAFFAAFLVLVTFTDWLDKHWPVPEWIKFPLAICNALFLLYWIGLMLRGNVCEP